VDIEFLSLSYTRQGAPAVGTREDYGLVNVVRLLESGIANFTEILALGAIVVAKVVVGSTALSTGYIFINILVLLRLLTGYKVLLYLCL
jgi:hypothetical protein